MNTTPAARAVRRAALALGLALFVIYNANGRELQPVDSQPTKLAARALARDGVLTLDRDIASKPGLADRVAFQKDLQGHTRSAYSVVPSLIAAVPAWVLSRMGIIDLDAPLAPSVIAVLTASAITAGAVVLVFLALCRFVSIRAALWTAVGLGLGTNYWGLVSRTLWQHETVAFGLALALWAWLRPTASISRSRLVLGGVGLALAVTCRLQVAPLAGVLVLWLWARVGFWRACIPGVVAAAAVLSLFAAQYRWFGDVLGGFAAMQAVALNPNAHGVTGSLSHEPWIGILGLLISPSRGVIIFSPVVLLVGAGARRSLREYGDLRMGWLLGAAAAQFALYGCYSVWWGGFTFGPRYMLDLLVPLAPAAAFGVDAALGQPWSRLVAGTLLAWSLLVAATGAFVYPNDAWNTSPASADTHHDRFWDWRDMQIVRAWKRGPSPQNFDLFDRAAIRPVEPSREP